MLRKPVHSMKKNNSSFLPNVYIKMDPGYIEILTVKVKYFLLIFKINRKYCRRIHFWYIEKEDLLRKTSEVYTTTKTMLF